MLEICHQHGSSFKVDHTVTACLYLLQRRRINGDRALRGSRGRRLLLNPGTTTSAPFSHERDATILGVNRTVMAEKEITTDKGTPALQALEGSFLGIWFEV